MTMGIYIIVASMFIIKAGALNMCVDVIIIVMSAAIIMLHP